MSQFSPNLFILGAAKCGTTALHDMLSRVDGVCMSNPKEPYFFECEFEKGLDYYRNTYFAHWQGEGIIGESRHRNLYLPYIPDRLFFVNSNPKFIVVLRNPVERAFSHWWHFYSRNQEVLDFKDAVREDIARIKSGRDLSTKTEREGYCANLNGFLNGIYRTYVDSGYYFEQIKRYHDTFGLDNLLILNFDELKGDQTYLKQKIANHLDIDFSSFESSQISSNTRKVVQRRGLIRKIGTVTGLKKIVPVYLKEKYHKASTDKIRASAYDKETILMLKKHYLPHNKRLESIIDFDITDWY